MNNAKRTVQFLCNCASISHEAHVSDCLWIFKEVESFETRRSRHTYALTNGSQLRKERKHFERDAFKTKN